MENLPKQARWVIVGAGFAGAATAWALGRRRLGPGVMLEQESVYGFHASGRNAALLRVAESDTIIRALVLRSLGHIRQLERPGEPLLRSTGGLSLVDRAAVRELERQHDELRRDGLQTRLLPAAEAKARFPLLGAVRFHMAMLCPLEGVVDIHALLTLYLNAARKAGFTLHTSCRVEELLVEAGRVVGVHTGNGDIRADAVIDATGAWAGRLGRASRPLPLQPLRRHLFVFGPPSGGHQNCPFAWMEDAAFYFRPEGDGLLFSPCDETPMAPCDPAADPAVSELLAEKLARSAPAFVDLPLRKSWACLRTFAPDRRPMIGPDPEVPGLFHVSGLGGFGMSASAAVGELAGEILAGGRPDWIDVGNVAPGRPF